MKIASDGSCRISRQEIDLLLDIDPEVYEAFGAVSLRNLICIANRVEITRTRLSLALNGNSDPTLKELEAAISSPNSEPVCIGPIEEIIGPLSDMFHYSYVCEAEFLRPEDETRRLIAATALNSLLGENPDYRFN